MINVARHGIAALLLAFSALAQDPLQVAPQHYRLDLENDWVKVLRVHYGPRETSVLHQHPAGPTVFVYVDDGGRMQFHHDEGLLLERPPVKAGGIRFTRGNAESHHVKYLGDTPTTYLRVELKTEPVELLAVGRDVRLAREPSPQPGAGLVKTQFANGQIRIVRLICPAGGTCPPPANPADPALVVAITPGVLSGRKVVPGDSLWCPAGATPAWNNTAPAEFEAVRIELRSRPLAAAR
jgi:quercetin dioxygenase-like cupin family protein